MLSNVRVRRSPLLSVIAVSPSWRSTRGSVPWFNVEATPEDGALRRVRRPGCRHPDVEIAVSLEEVGLHVNDIGSHAEVRHDLAFDPATDLPCARIPASPCQRP